MKKSKAILALLLTILFIVGIAYVDVKGIDPEGTASASDIKLGLDLAGGVSITYQVVGDEDPSATDMSDTIGKLQKRVENYSKEAIVYQEGIDRINIEIPGVTDANQILKELGKPGALYFIAETDASGNPNYMLQNVQDENGNAIGMTYVLTRPLEELMEDGSVVLEGTDVKSAQAVSMQDNMQNITYGVDIVMTEDGRQKFADATRNAFQKNETLGIYYDGYFVSVPGVNGEFTDGHAQITPMESFEEAESLASTIRIGGLKLELEELHSKVVGAQLGVEAIDTSLKAGAIGLAIVSIMMIAVYFVAGLASVVALLLYVVSIVLLLNGFDMTLTLSGIAGIILSIGMAVDANVIIFARIREELRTGKTVSSSIKIGFDKALSAIVDGNITTLIAAAVLFLIAPGSVKGFAETLALGIVLSMFTALVVTRYIMYAFYALGFKSEKWYGVGKEPRSIDFLSGKSVFFALSIAVIIGGFVMMGVNKSQTGEILNYSLEFKGGTATTVTFDTVKTLDEVNSEIVPAVEKIVGGPVQIQTVQDSNEVIFKTASLNLEQREQMNQMFIDDFNVEENMIVSETISSTISDEMKQQTILSVVIAIICMLIYIRVRFKDIRFGISSVVALCHDVLVVLAFYTVAKISISNTFIACMLTIVGYSINATIVIFDRVRENMAVMGRNDELKAVLNQSITQTLSRSIYTSLTTFVMVACLYGLGVTSIRDFALPLMVGILAGAYSSVCLAGAIWYVLRTKFVPKKSKN